VAGQSDSSRVNDSFLWGERSGNQALLECSSLKCGLQKSARRISGWRERTRWVRARQSSVVGVEGLFDESAAEQAKRKGARYLRRAKRHGGAYRSSTRSRILGTTKALRVVAALLPNLEGVSSALVRGVKRRLSRFTRGGAHRQAGDRVGSDQAVPPVRQGASAVWAIRERLIQPRRRGGSVSGDGCMYHPPRGHRDRSRQSWHEPTPLPPIAGPGSANCAACGKGIHVEAGHAADGFASSWAESVKKQQRGTYDVHHR